MSAALFRACALSLVAALSLFQAAAPGGASIDDIQRLYDRVAHIPARLYNLNWSSRFRINSRHMTTLKAGRIFFGGDAAHVHSPAGGQGMNAGIQDMINLSWKLAMVLDGRAKPELLDTYESDRLPVIRQLVGMTERATRVFNSTSPFVHAALTRLARPCRRRWQRESARSPRRIGIARLPRAAAGSDHFAQATGCRTWR